MIEPVARGAYGVKLVRGPFLRLSRHERHCSSREELLTLAATIRQDDPTALLAADLFSGAGGLSLGLEDAGINVVLAADHYAEAVETHSHHFAGMSVDWDLADPDVIQEVAALIRDAGIDVVAGGPPCQPFSKAGRSGMRHRVHHGLRDPHDERRDLWRSFLEVVSLSMPRVVLMENVPDMALDKEMFILRAIVEELEQSGYAVEQRVVESSRYGVPQFRQRLVLVALRGEVRFEWPEEAQERVTVWNAIGDMPTVTGGWRPAAGADGWIDYDGPSNTFQRRMRNGVATADSRKLFDHITRPVREDDARAFDLMGSETKYSDLPEEMKRYRDDIFDDKYKRLDENNLSRTITAHIAKDGYWYIHPRQRRTLTVREAARLQTFPDWYRFAGPPSAAFKQIGNAVPPRLASHLGSALRVALDVGEKATVNSGGLAVIIDGWFESLTRLHVPWLRAVNRWQVVAAELLLDRADPDHVRFIWPLIDRWGTPQASMNQDDALRQMGELIGRERRVAELLELADWLAEHPGALDDPELDRTRIPRVTEMVADLATLVVPTAGEDSSDEPVLVTKGILRVASRFWAEPVDRHNRLSDGRLAVARLIGGGMAARSAHLGLIELANSLCRPVDPLCRECPLSVHCLSSQADNQRASTLC